MIPLSFFSFLSRAVYHIPPPLTSKSPVYAAEKLCYTLCIIKREDAVMRIIFVRHGEPDYVRDCLTQTGKKQAQACALHQLLTHGHFAHRTAADKKDQFHDINSCSLPETVPGPLRVYDSTASGGYFCVFSGAGPGIQALFTGTARP
jgi:hypothetical protein